MQEASGGPSAANLQAPLETEEQTRHRASRLKVSESLALLFRSRNPSAGRILSGLSIPQEAFVKETERMLLDTLESVYSRVSRLQVIPA